MMWLLVATLCSVTGASAVMAQSHKFTDGQTAPVVAYSDTRLIH